MSGGLPGLVAGEEGLRIGLSNSRLGWPNLVLQTPCVTPVDSEFGLGISLSEQTEERRSPKRSPSVG